jgi:cobalt-zinc-cadmium resistance protein CzcA
MLTANNGTPVLLSSDVADVRRHLPRLGIAGQDDDDDIVQGIVLMRRGAESMPTIKARRGRGREDQQLRHPAAGRAYRAIYDRSDLINVTTHTVLHNMVVGMC